MAYTTVELATVILGANRRKFHPEPLFPLGRQADGHAVFPDACETCREFAVVAAAAVVDLLARAEQESQR